jgi:hypothetical protein
MSTPVIVEYNNISYDGVSFCIERQKEPCDIVVQNTKGPIHLASILQFLNIPQIPSVDLENYELLSKHMKDVHAKFLHLFLPQSEDEPPKSEIRDIVKTYYTQSQGLKGLEGKNVLKCSKKIATDMGKPLTVAHKEILDMFIMLDREKFLVLSNDKSVFAPHIPSDIDSKKGDVTIDRMKLECMFSVHMKILSSTNVFEKLVNIIANSCLRKECDLDKSKRYAYFAAEIFVREFIYMSDSLTVDKEFGILKL